jgi:hypothetical protein
MKILNFFLILKFYANLFENLKFEIILKFYEILEHFEILKFLGYTI